MQWTLKGAPLLLQTRTKVLNNELEDVFRRWFPRFRPKVQATSPEQKARLTPDFLVLSHAVNSSSFGDQNYLSRFFRSLGPQHPFSEAFPGITCV